MKFRTALIAFVLTLFSLTAVHAQAQAPAQGSESPGERGMHRMLKDITLTSAEQAKVDSIVAHYRSQMPPMKEGVPPDSATKAAHRALMEKVQADIRAVLTEDQRVTFDKNVAEMRAHMEQRMNEPHS